MEFSQVVAERHSVRDFTDRPVSSEDLVDIVRTAQRAPSWVNSQPWRVYAATGSTLETIKNRHAADVAAGRKGSAELPVKARSLWSQRTQANMAALGEQIGAELGEGAQEFQASQGRLFNAQAVLYVTIPVDSTLWSFHDLGAFTAMLALAAADKGLGSINAYQLVMYPDEVRQTMGIGADETLAVGIALGYAADSALAGFSPSRVEVDQILTFKE
ncbi:nitroreductase [Actinomyces viscosus]|uniref:nitroreductase n=1 Tax=Actinomyces viscosus TaxID=1656 RepID=UPI0028ED74D5|nr:nitroreductase [Actinomyces viscosus]